MMRSNLTDLRRYKAGALIKGAYINAKARIWNPILSPLFNELRIYFLSTNLQSDDRLVYDRRDALHRDHCADVLQDAQAQSSLPAWEEESDETDDTYRS